MPIGTQINNLETMLMSFFWTEDTVDKARLERKVHPDVIALALAEGLIQTDASLRGGSKYRITEAGKKYLK